MFSCSTQHDDNLIRSKKRKLNQYWEIYKSSFITLPHKATHFANERVWYSFEVAYAPFSCCFQEKNQLYSRKALSEWTEKLQKSNPYYIWRKLKCLWCYLLLGCPNQENGFEMIIRIFKKDSLSILHKQYSV